MADFDAQVQVDMDGNLASQAKRAEKAVHSMTTRAGRDFKRLRSASIGLSNGINKLGNRYSGMITGAGLALAAKGVVDFGARLKDIEVQAGLTGDQIKTLKGEIFAVSKDEDIRINPDELLGAVEAIVEKTGDLKLAQDNLENMGLAIRAVGARGGDIGAVIAGLKKLGITEPDEVRKALELLIEQGKAGAFTFQNLAAEAGPLMSTLAAMGQKGMGAVRTLGALAQTTQMITDNSAESSTAIQALMREIAKKGADLEKKGITVFDPKAAAEGKKQYLELDKIIRSILERSKGDMERLNNTFEGEAVRALSTLATDFQDNGQLNLLDQFMAIQADGTKIVADASAKTQTMSAAIESLNGEFTRLANTNLAGPIHDLADALNSLNSEELTKLFNMAAGGVAAAAGIWTINKAIRATSAGVRLVQGLRGRASAGGIAGKALSQAAAQPVIVTNWPAGGYGYGGQGGGRGRKGQLRLGGMTTRGGRFSGITRLAGRAGGLVRGAGPLALAMGALQMGSAAMDGDGKGVAGGAGMMGGGLAGAKLGALAGTFAGPIGIAVGSVLGGTLGAYLGGEGLEALYSSMFSDNKDNNSNGDQKELVAATSRLSQDIQENTRARQTKSPRRHNSYTEMGGLEVGAP